MRDNTRFFSDQRIATREALMQADTPCSDDGVKARGFYEKGREVIPCIEGKNFYRCELAVLFFSSTWWPDS